jgi:hypothetical protein
MLTRYARRVIALCVGSLFALSAFGQPRVSINALPAGGAIAGPNLTICDQSNATNACTFTQVLSFIQSNLTLPCAALPALTGVITSAGCTTNWASATGTGAVVLANSPTLITPALGTPSALVLTNAIGLPLSVGVTGVLPVPNGGTGAVSLSGLIRGNGASALTSAATGDVVALWTGTCNSTTYMRADGQCQPVGGGSPAFGAITTGTNLVAAMLVGTGSSLGPTGTGTVSANQVNGGTVPASASVLASNASSQVTAAPTTGTGNVVLATSPTLTLGNATGLPFSGLSGATNTTAAMLVGTGSSLAPTGTGTITATSLNALSGLPAIATQRVLGNGSGSTAAPAALTLGNNLVATSSTLATTQPLNAQTGTSYAIATTDAGKLITFSNAAATAVSLSQATTAGFTAGFSFDVENKGAGVVTLTPATSTVNGAATLALGQNQGCTVTSDGTNYQVSACTALSGLSTVASQTVLGNGSGSTAVPIALTLTGNLVASSTTLGTVQLINAQSGTSYALLSSDAGKLVTFNNAAATAVSLAQATTTGFQTGFSVDVQNLGAGVVTITPAVSTIDGLATLVILQNQGCSITSDGTNYQVSACDAVAGNNLTQAANTSLDGVTLIDSTAASAGNQQFSPRLRFTGQGWKTTATAASQPVDWIIENEPVQGTTAPNANLVFSRQVNGGGYLTALSIPNTGNWLIGDATTNLSGGYTFIQTGTASFGGKVQALAFVSGGATFTVASGTGACATTSTLTGGGTVGQFTCTGTTGASTATLTFTNVAHGYSCSGRDVTTPTTVTQTGAISTTSVTLTLTSVTANDVIQFGCLGY